MRTYTGVRGEFIDCTFIGNTAAARGGAIMLNGFSTTMAGCIFVNNRASEASALSHAAGFGHFERCAVAFNEATVGGAAVLEDASSGDLNFWENVAIVKNLSPTGNGGLIISESSNVAFLNCTVADNSATAESPAIVIDDLGAPAVAFVNCLFALQDDGNLVYKPTEGAVQIHNTLIDAPDDTSITGTVEYVLDGLPATFADMQGSADFADAPNGNYDLLATSDAIDFGAKQDIIDIILPGVTLPTVDIIDRPRDSAPDAGAYENQEHTGVSDWRLFAD